MKSYNLAPQNRSENYNFISALITAMPVHSIAGEN